MTGFDTATSSCLALLVNNQFEKMKESKFKKVFNLVEKTFQSHFLSRTYCQVNHLRTLKGFVCQ